MPAPGDLRLAVGGRSVPLADWMFDRMHSELLESSHARQRQEEAVAAAELGRRNERRLQMAFVEARQLIANDQALERSMQMGYAAGLLAMSPYARGGVPGPRR